MRLPPGQFGIPMPLNQEKKKGISLLARMIHPNYQEEIELMPDNWRPICGSQGILWLPFSTFTSKSKVDGKLQHPNQSGPQRVQKLQE